MGEQVAYNFELDPLTGVYHRAPADDPDRTLCGIPCFEFWRVLADEVIRQDETCPACREKLAA